MEFIEVSAKTVDDAINDAINNNCYINKPTINC